jgi:hypothetical protein
MASPNKNRHQWTFYRAGEVDQVVLASGEDLAHLDELDQKLWLSLACPTRGLEFPTRTLDFLDTDKDGRIRVPEVLEAIHFVRDVFRNLDDLFKGQTELAIDAISDATKAGKELRAGAVRILENLGKGEAKVITLDDVADTAKIFAATRFNGDGIVPSHSADDEPTRLAIDDIIKTHGSLLDRSGKPGIDQPLLDQFFDDAKTYAEWLDKGEGTASPRAFGAATDAAEVAVRAVAAKLDDYFLRCRMATFDTRAAGLLNAPEAELVAASAKDLSVESAEIAKLPLARVEAWKALSFSQGLNPAWESRIATFVKDAVTPILGPGKALLLTEEDWTSIKSALAPFVAWLGAKPVTKVDVLGAARVRELLAGNARQAIADLIAKDAALAAESNQIETVEKAILYRRDLVRLLKNFVNFAEFYGDGRAIFQTGTLYLDARSCDLCLPVEDVAKHASLAGLARAYLVYCDCTRKDREKRGIVAAFTGGDTDNLMVGRNGIFYDRQGNDWDATITKIIENPISIRQAFWSPYKSFVRMIEAQVAKRAAAADQDARSKVESTAVATAHVDKTKEEAAKKAESKKIDVGTVAAIGVAVGGIATFFSGVLATFFGLGMWMPAGLVALILAISGPSMLIAWLKLRQRNVGPILDANGWAVNALAKINVPFGGALTKVAKLPFGTRRRLRDPFAPKRRSWGLYFLLLVVVVLASLWYLGKLDPHLPAWIQSGTVLKGK